MEFFQQNGKLDSSKDLAEQLAFSEHDDEATVAQLKDILTGVTSKDLEQILACDSFSPQVFTSYIRLMSYFKTVSMVCDE